MVVTKALNNQIAPKSLKRKKSCSPHLREHPGHPWQPRGGLQPVVVMVLSHTSGLGAFQHGALSPQGLQDLVLIIKNDPRLWMQLRNIM